MAFRKRRLLAGVNVSTKMDRSVSEAPKTKKSVVFCAFASCCTEFHSVLLFTVLHGVQCGEEKVFLLLLDLAA